MSEIEQTIKIIDSYRCIDCYFAHLQFGTTDPYDFDKVSAEQHINETTGPELDDTSHWVSPRFLGVRIPEPEPEP